MTTPLATSARPPGTAAKQDKARRQRDWRRRRACGIKLLQVPVDEYRLLNALIASGSLPSAADALDELAVRHAVAGVLMEWAEFWERFDTSG